jgi:F0F1-type ATP synthase membrane subunit b/b'
MTENTNDLLVVFKDNVHDLIKICDERQRRIEELTSSIENKNEEIRQANETIESLQSKYANLLTARILAKDETEIQNARKLVSKLVREVETCITLLNE